MFDALSAPGRARISTPGWLVRAAGVIVLLAVLAAGAVLWAAGGIQDAARTIGRDAEPSVALALRITATLADMNAAAVGDSLTENAAASGTSRAFRVGEAALSTDLVQAARNITYGRAESDPLEQLQAALLGYEEAVVESRYIGGTDALITSRRVQWASRVNREIAAPAAQALADANATVLEDRWSAYQARWLPGLAIGVAALVLLAAVLVAVQLWLLRRTRRVINLPLAAATAICAAAAVWFGSQAISGHGTLRAAKQDAYDSLCVLFHAKAAVYAIRSDMSLWLLDPTIRAEAAARIGQSEQALIGAASTDTPTARALAAGMQAAMQTEQQGDAARALTQVPKTGGLLGAELSNVTFGVPEREAATAAVNHLLEAVAYVQAIQAQAVRDRAGAATNWLREAPGGGVPVFAAEQDALDRTIAVNQSEFDRDTTEILASAALIAPATLAALALVALLSAGGLWLRLREYG